MRTIVFARHMPTFRIYKFAKALKKQGGYKTKLLGVKIDKEMFQNIFDEIYSPSSFLNTTIEKRNIFGRILSKAVRFGKKIPIVNKVQKKVLERTDQLRIKEFTDLVKKVEKEADLFHVVTEPNDIPEAVMKNAKKPVIYDVYDFTGLRFGIEELDKSEKEREKFCLEKADGISFKFPEWILNYYRKLGYKINCPILTFIDYCLPEFFSYQEKDLKRGDIHLVYTGVVAPTSANPVYNANNQHIETIQKIIAQRIYFHLYLPPWYAEIQTAYADYYELSKKNKYFIIHGSKNQPDLQKEISKYHFGCTLNDFSKTKHTKLFGETSFGNKFSTYLEAGLPILVSDRLKLNAEYVEKYGVGIKVDINNLGELSKKIKEIDYQKLKENVKRERESSLNIYNNINKLTNFYDKIIANKKYGE